MENILAVDVGNSNIAFGIFSDGNLTARFKIRTKSIPDRITLKRELKKSLKKSRWNSRDLNGSVISSVVPRLNPLLTGILRELTGKDPLMVTAHLQTGIKIKDYDTGTLGVDRIVDCAAAYGIYGAPLILYDLGTATTLSVLNRDGCFLGGMISIGVQLSLNTLGERAAQLPVLRAVKTDRLIGNDTQSCMVNGAVIGTAAMIDGVSERIMKELGEQNIPIVLTGGVARCVIPWCTHPVHYEPNLMLKGLYEIYKQNT